MLNPNDNRLDYGEILSPPNNYQLDFAIGTTYSLDLDALVGAAISLGLSEETDTNLVNNPIFLLEALRTTGDNVILFCEGGQIHLPNQPNPLYILLEEMVFQVNNSNMIQSRYASFHPKFWLLRYIGDENKVLYRVVVLSRNLTFDRSSDISVSMDGFIREERTDKNDPMKDFLKYLADSSTNDEKNLKIFEIIDELSFVHFELNSREFCDFDFIPNGIGDYSIVNYPLFNDSFDEILIMSPFLSKLVIKAFNDNVKNNEALLFTRENSLNGLSDEDCGNFEIYALKDQIIDGESSFSEGSEEDSKNEIIKQDIHAKLFMARHGDFTDLYLGSLNASYNALYGNVEFMVKLRARSDKLNLKTLSEGLFDGEKGGPNSPFQLVNIDNISPDIIAEPNNDLNLAIKFISRLSPKSKVISNGKYYDIELSFDDSNIGAIKYLDDLEIKIRPLLSKKESRFANHILFENLDKISLSEFFVVSIKEKIDEENFKVLERVIKISTIGLPEDREKEVISSVVNDKEAFIRYVAFLLGDKYVLTAMEAESGFGSGSSGISFQIQLPELYEKMLRASVYSPEKFDELEFLIKTLSGDDVIPEGFEELYNTFKKAVDKYE